MAKSISRYLADISSTSGVLDGTLSTAAQTNITSLGTLSSLTVSGAMNGTLSTAAQPNITSVGTLTALTVDDITIDGSTISDGGDLTIDVAGQIILDADSGGDILFRDGGTDYGKVSILNGDWVLTQPTANKDILFKGNDGNALTALTLDMSDAGTAIFNHDAHLSDNGKLVLGTGADTQMYYDGSRLNINNTGDVVLDTSGNIYLDADGGKVYLQDAGTEKIRFVMDNAGYVQIYSAVSDDDIKIQGNDGGSVVDALVFDMSEGGAATFNGELIAPNGATEGYHIKQTGGTATPRITNDANNWTILRPGASGSDVAINNYANTANLVVFTDEGKVGIATDNPYSKFEVVSTSTSAFSSSSFNADSLVGLKSTDGVGRYAVIRFTNVNGNIENLIGFEQTHATSNQKADFVIQGYSRDAGAYREKLRITDAGYVTKPQQPSFHARLANATGVNASSGVHLYYGNHSVTHNNGSHFKTSGSDAYMFVAPVAGKYYFSANLRVDAFSGNYSYLTLWKINTARSASTIYSRDLSAAQLAYQNHNVQAVIDMSANEAVWVQYQNNGDSSVNHDADSFFSGYLIG